jgi:hypothetical protein
MKTINYTDEFTGHREFVKNVCSAVWFVIHLIST